MFTLLFEGCLRFSFSDPFCAELLEPFCLWEDVLSPLLQFPEVLGMAPSFINEDCIFSPLKAEGVVPRGPGEGEWILRYRCRTSTFPFAVSFGSLVCLCSSWYRLCKCKFLSISFVSLVGALLPLSIVLLGVTTQLLNSNRLPGSVESIWKQQWCYYFRDVSIPVSIMWSQNLLPTIGLRTICMYSPGLYVCCKICNVLGRR